MDGSFQNSQLILAQSLGQLLYFLAKFSVQLQFLSVRGLNVDAMGNFLTVVVLLTDQRGWLILLRSVGMLQELSVLSGHGVVSGSDLSLSVHRVGTVKSSFFSPDRFFF